jgi:preprotein translocase subunit SecB
MADEKPGATDRRLSILKIYLKDASFESPLAPTVFQTRDWSPKTDLNLRSEHKPLENDVHEVVLTITVEAKDNDGDKTLFLLELQQAGLFEIAGYPAEELGVLVGSFAPNMLFPYAREAIAGLVQKGGFPEFLLQPINFDALYQQSRQQRQDGTAQAKPETH